MWATARWGDRTCFAAAQFSVQAGDGDVNSSRGTFDVPQGAASLKVVAAIGGNRSKRLIREFSVDSTPSGHTLISRDRVFNYEQGRGIYFSPDPKRAVRVSRLYALVMARSELDLTPFLYGAYLEDAR